MNAMNDNLAENLAKPCQKAGQPPQVTEVAVATTAASGRPAKLKPSQGSSGTKPELGLARRPRDAARVGQRLHNDSAAQHLPSSESSHRFFIQQNQ